MNLDTRTQPVRPPLEGYYSRVMAYLCVALVFAALAREQGLTPITGGAVLYALIYPHLMRLIARWRNKGQRSQFNLVLLALDAVHTGVFITLCQFSMVPSLVFLLLISFTAIIIGGPLYLFSALLLALTGTMLAFGSLAGGGIFTVVMAMFIYRQGRHLEQAQEVISAEQEKAATLASNLAKYLSPQVWESIFSGNQKVTLETRRKKLTVFF